MNTRVKVKSKLWLKIYKSRYIYLMLIPTIILTILFKYFPLGGIKIAFQDYNLYQPEKSEWVGLENFIRIFQGKALWAAVWNTLKLSGAIMIVCFPLNILFALLMNEILNAKFKKVVQTITYLPHFLSWISVIGIVSQMLSRNGVINDVIEMMGGERRLLLAEQALFLPLCVFLTLWKGIGWSSILYFAAIAGIDPNLYEAASLDGANRLQRVWHITLPSIKGTIAIQLIYTLSGLFGSNFELVYGLQNAYIEFEVIETYVYKHGIVGGSYAEATAFGLAQGLISLALLLLANVVVKKLTDTGIF